jgi:hypothetical protein
MWWSRSFCSVECEFDYLDQKFVGTGSSSLLISRRSHLLAPSDGHMYQLVREPGTVQSLPDWRVRNIGRLHDGTTCFWSVGSRHVNSSR